MSSRFPAIRERRARERRVWGVGLALSVLIHILVVMLWPVGEVSVSSEAAAGPRSGDARAAAGGMQAVQVSAPSSSIARPPPPLPRPSVEPVPPPDIEDASAIDPGEVLGARPELEEPGTEIGAGRGDGGSAEEGRFGIVPPSPRGMIVPPSNDALRGHRISVWVFVDETGRVVPDSTRLEPPTGDRDFNRRLIDEASQWVFEPAKEGDEPVAAWFPYTIRM